MSFPLQCDNCGAPSGPSVGVCPYCKKVFQCSKVKGNPTITNIRAFFDKGELPKALSLASLAEKEKPDLLNNESFVLLYAKVLLETEAPSSKVRALLQKAQMSHPDNTEIAEYLELIDAKGNLKQGRNDVGELELKNVLRRSPNNPHALFFLGSHLFWVDKDARAGLVFLEKAVRWRPNFLRALACLAAIYQSIGAEAQSLKLFQKCVVLENDPTMKEFFKKMAAGGKMK